MPRHRTRRRRLPLIASALIIAVVLAGGLAAAAQSAEHHSALRAATARPDESARPHPRPVPVATRPAATAPTLQERLAAAARYGAQRSLRVGIAVADLTTGAITSAGDAGTFGTASVIKMIVATKMLLDGAMTGDDAAVAREMIIGSNDDDCSLLWGKFGGPDIITWVGRHYGIHIGEPNIRDGYWGDTRTTAAGLAGFYLAVSRDPMVWPWLNDAMAHAKRIADDGTDQYFGIPDAGGGHVVKQGWGQFDSGDGYQPNATVNSTGIVTAGAHRYAVVLLTEGHDNVSQADGRGLVRAQADVLTAIAAQVLGTLRSGSPVTGAQ